MAATVGGAFDQGADLLDRLRQGPGEEARREVAPQPEVPGPPPSRWSLRTIRVSVPALRNYCLSGVWRVLQRCDCRQISPKVRLFSPDREYRSKEATLLRCLQQVAQAPERRVLLFLDEIGYDRWPTTALNWQPADRMPPEELECAGNNSQWRLARAVGALSGQVDYLDNYSVGRKQLLSFYGRLDQRYSELIIRAFAEPSSQAACPSGRTSPAVSPRDRGSAVGSDSRTRHGAAPTLHRSRR